MSGSRTCLPGLRLAVTGRPVMHSMSPEIFRKLFAEAGISGFYSRLAADSAEEALQTALLAGLDSLNITSPFKNSAAALADLKEEAASKLNASNLLVIPERHLKKNIKAYNTDYTGVADSAAAVYAGLKRGKASAFVAGAGGAGLAAAWGLSLAGFEVSLFSRNPQKTADIAAGIKNCFGKKLSDLSSELRHADILVNALPVPDVFFDPENLLPHTVIFDADYKNRPLEKTAADKGCRYISGYEWLINQALHGFKIFTLKEDAAETYPAVNKEEILKKLDSYVKLFPVVSLTGFMGTGKTSSGIRLAGMLKKKFVDTDSEIEKSENMEISAIFSTRGESYFRSAEKRMINKILEREKSCVLSCGGGAVIDPENQKILKDKTLPVWLVCDIRESVSRIRDKSRPLLSEGDVYQKAEKIFRDRIDAYGNISELIINSGIRSREKLAGRIYEEISSFISN